MRKLLVANWKENPKTEKQAMKLFGEIVKAAKGRDIEVVVCPPFIYIEEISNAFKKSETKKLRIKKNLSLGAQDVFWEEKGPYTGEAGPTMLRSLGVKYVIIGHSERRRWLHETDVMINKKIKLALRDGLKVILCVGEPLAVRKRGIAGVKDFIKNQLKKDLAGIGGVRAGTTTARIENAGITIAYEPIWAIGTDRSDTPRDAADMANFIKKFIGRHFGTKRVRVLYGGSVNRKNIVDFVQLKEIDGALVGGASLKAEEFGDMIKIASKQ